METKLVSYSDPLQENQELPEKKLETGKKVFEFLNRIKLLDIRKSDEQFNEWLQELPYKEYISHLTRLNGILRRSPIKNRSVDGDTVEVAFRYGLGGTDTGPSYLPPAAEQKDELMRESFNALKQIPDNEDRALLAYYTIQAIHPYSDGNGRTGRLLCEIFSNKEKGLTVENLSALLDHDKKGHGGTGKGRDAFAEKVLKPEKAYYLINREVVKQVLGEDFINENGSIFISSITTGNAFIPETIKQNISFKDSSLVKKILGEDDVKHFSFRGITLAKFIQEKPEMRKYLHEAIFKLSEKRRVVPEDYGKKPFIIDGEGITSALTEEDVQRLIIIHKEIKITFIKTMIDIFTHPENHKIKNEEGENVLIKDVFRR